jgi:hypothetical protein
MGGLTAPEQTPHSAALHLSGVGFQFITEAATG